MARVVSDERDEPINRTRRQRQVELAPLRTRKMSDAETARNNQLNFGGVGLQGEQRSQQQDARATIAVPQQQRRHNDNDDDDRDNHNRGHRGRHYGCIECNN